MKNKKFQNKDQKYDICFIGYGLATIYLVNLLSPFNKKILIIEKGTYRNSSNNKNRNINLGIHHKASKNFSGIKMGGNSSRWGGQLVEMTKEDFTKCYWGANYKDFVKLYKNVYKVFGIKKNFQEKKITNEFYKYKSIFLTDPDLFKKFKFDKKKNIKIVQNTTAINFAYKKNKITEIICKNVEKKIINFKSKIFIIANGSIESNRLMLMNKKCKGSPFGNNRNIGKYFSDHIGFYAGKLRINNDKNFREDFENFFIKGNSIQQKIRYYDKINKLNVSVEFKFISKFEKEIQDAKNLIKEMKFNFKFYKILKIFLNSRLLKIFFQIIIYYFRTGRIKAFYDKAVLLYFQSEHVKNPKSKIFLKNEKLKDGMNKTFVNWKIGNVERRIFVNLCDKLDKYFKKKQYGNLEISKNLCSNRLFYKNILDTNHSSGGLQISKNNKYGVCNENLKVHGTKNLYVLSSSVFPINGSANITLTLFALTHKFFLNIKEFIKKI